MLGPDGPGAAVRHRFRWRSPPGRRPRPAQAASLPALVPAPAPTARERDQLVFTGIVEELGRVVAVEHGAQSARLTVEGPVVAADAAHGTSIAVDGVCLPVVERLLRATAEVAA